MVKHFINSQYFVTIIKLNEYCTIDSMTILVIFQPMILELAGNCGTNLYGKRKISNYELDKSKPIFAHIGRNYHSG